MRDREKSVRKYARNMAMTEKEINDHIAFLKAYNGDDYFIRNNTAHENLGSMNLGPVNPFNIYKGKK